MEQQQFGTTGPMLLEVTMNPYFLSGLAEGEGCFSVCAQRNLLQKTGIQISLCFEIKMNSRELLLLQEVKSTFGCGIISTYKNGFVTYRVRRFKDIVDKVIPFFDSYPLLGGKKSDFHYFKIIAEIMKSGVHNTPGGIEQVRKIRVNMHQYDRGAVKVI